MSAVLLGHAEVETPAWHALRANGLGGSEIAAVVGLSPWVSRYSLYFRKRGELAEQAEVPKMTWGKRLEPLICDVFAELHPDLRLEVAGTYQHEDRTWQLANVDRLLLDSQMDVCSLLEVKTADKYDAFEWGPDGSDEIPPYYRCQTLWYLDVFGLPYAHLAVLIGGNDYRQYRVEYAPDEAAWLREEGLRFWNDVLMGNKPDIDSHSDTYQAVRAMHPDIDRGEEVELDRAVYDIYEFTKRDAEEASAAHQKAKSELLEQMGNAQFGCIDGESVVRRQPARGGNVALYQVARKKTTA